MSNRFDSGPDHVTVHGVGIMRSAYDLQVTAAIIGAEVGALAVRPASQGQPA